jgi:hypothetical protein
MLHEELATLAGRYERRRILVVFLRMFQPTGSRSKRFGENTLHARWYAVG